MHIHSVHERLSSRHKHTNTYLNAPPGTHASWIYNASMRSHTHHHGFNSSLVTRKTAGTLIHRHTDMLCHCHSSSLVVKEDTLDAYAHIQGRQVQPCSLKRLHAKWQATLHIFRKHALLVYAHTRSVKHTQFHQSASQASSMQPSS